jgi:LmbE family N-acetylglucosaminyl deacetylase
LSSVLVVCAHPDDEAIGCGGALRRHALDGDDITAVFLTSGEAGGHGIQDAGATREAEALAAGAILGLSRLEFWREPDGGLRARNAVVSRVSELISRLEPALLYAPHSRDDHPDHRAAARIVASAVAASASRAERRHFEIWSPLAHIAEVVDISAVIDDKLRAIRAYSSQCAVMNFDEAFHGLARYRGEMHSWPGGAYAEVFSRR